METATLAMAGSGAATGGAAAAGGLGLLGAFGSLQAGKYQAAAYKAQSKQYELSAKAEELKGRDQADKIRRSLQSTLASQNAAFGARGISLNSGTARSLATQSMSDASSDISRAQFGSGYAAESLRMEASGARSAARQARIQSYMAAAGGLVNTAKAAGGMGGF
jgi:hypothetical protein